MTDGPLKTVRGVLSDLRDKRDACVTIALQDFMELSPDEQMEFLLASLLNMHQSVESRLRDLETE